MHRPIAKMMIDMEMTGIGKEIDDCLRFDRQRLLSASFHRSNLSALHHYSCTYPCLPKYQTSFITAKPSQRALLLWLNHWLLTCSQRPPRRWRA
jgi:hypothetical protein